MERIYSKMKICPTKLSYSGDSEQEAIDRENERIGDWEGFDCKLCKNKGHIAIKGADGRMAMQPCSCVKIRKAKRLIKESGIISECSFKDFKATEDYQKIMLEKAKAFVAGPTGKWFYMSGQNGIGKSLLCTAMVNELLNKYIPCKYMLWRDESVRLKANVNNDEIHYPLITALKTIDVLYIDDFLKTGQGEVPTKGDMDLAFELLNHRYNSRLTTIISCERSLKDVINIGEAVGSRISEKVGKFNIYVAKDITKNYRLK